MFEWQENESGEMVLGEEEEYNKQDICQHGGSGVGQLCDLLHD